MGGRHHGRNRIWFRYPRPYGGCRGRPTVRAGPPAVMGRSPSTRKTLAAAGYAEARVARVQAIDPKELRLSCLSSCSNAEGDDYSRRPRQTAGI